MSWEEMPNRIPAEPIAKVIRSYLESEGTRLCDGSFTPASTRILAERADMNGDTLEKILGGRSRTIDFDDADRLLCVTNLTDLWNNDLADLYQGIVLDDNIPRHRVARVSGAKMCERRGCSEVFIPPSRVPKKKYCSKQCRTAAWAHIHRGIKTQMRGKNNSLLGLICRNGHERTAENTMIDRRGKRVCMICKRATDHRSYKGPRGGVKKLTIEQVREIRVSSESLSALGRRFGVDRSTIGLVRTGKTWANAT